MKYFEMTGLIDDSGLLTKRPYISCYVLYHRGIILEKPS